MLARIRALTTTLARDARMHEPVERERGRIDARTAVAILRDRRGVGDARLPLGNRNALDAIVWTHSVVADLTARVLWVSEGPHTLGRYGRIDLPARLRDGATAAAREAEDDIAADPALADGTWARLELGARLRDEAHVAAGARQWDAAVDLYRRATLLRPEDHLAWRGLAEAAARRGDAATARAAWQRVVDLAPEGPAALAEARTHLN